MHEKEIAYKAWLEPSQTYMMKFFLKTVRLPALNYFLKKFQSFIYIWHGSKYTLSYYDSICYCNTDDKHFLAQNPSKLLNGQHKWVCCPFSIGPFSIAVHLFSIGPGLVLYNLSYFKFLPTSIFYFVGQTPPETCNGDIEKNKMIKSIMKRQIFFI